MVGGAASGAVKYDQAARPLRHELVLIVDDEESIRRTLQGVLEDEGFATCVADNGVAALAAVRERAPSLVILDIWMSGMDGMETLRQLREILPEVPVIMISGHATIATAVAATKRGAADFIEKPLDLNLLLKNVERALASRGAGGVGSQQRESAIIAPDSDVEFGPSARGLVLNPIALRDQSLRGRAFPQRTLARSALLYGQGLHSGRKSGLILEPLPVGSGIHFVGVSDPSAVPAHVDFVESTGFATTVRLGSTSAGTIEHLMSALHAYGISNLLVKCNGEVPVLDGSAVEFCSLFDEVGIEDQAAGWYEIAIRSTLRVGGDREYIQIEPHDEFVIDYTLDYPKPVGMQRLVFTFGDVAAYRKEIASARTFGFVRDIGMLQRQGLALGGRFDNFVLFGDEGPINDALRFPDEPVRHKILDMVGDLFLLGRRLRGKVTARMTGHSDNIALLRLIREALKASV